MKQLRNSLRKGFHDQFIEVGYTREIEQELDQVAEGKKQWTDMLHEFYEELVPKIEFADQLKHKKAESTPSE